MKPWVIGIALSPFLALLLVWIITGPIRRAVQKRMTEGPIKRLLLLDRDKHPWKYGLAWFILVFGAMIAVALVFHG